MKWIGSKYGGWHVNLERIAKGSTVISAGLGNDISFDEELIRLKGVRVIGVDPTNLTKKTIDKKKPKNFTLIRKALYVGNTTSVTTCDTNGASIYDSKPKTSVECVGLHTLLNTYKNVSLVKMNIEGAEYEIIKDIVKTNIPQILVRFHHRKPGVPFSYTDTLDCIKKMQDMGYKFFSFSDPNNKKVDYEAMFLL
jgi:FkbM family methyltransferase